MKQPKRGEIYFLDFSPSKGREMKGSHPALVIQNDVGNKVGSLTIVAAITSNLKVAEFPVGVMIKPEKAAFPINLSFTLGDIYCSLRRGSFADSNEGRAQREKRQGNLEGSKRVPHIPAE